MVYIAWLFGFLGTAVGFTILHQKNRKNLLAAKLISDIFWIIHYTLIGARSGAAVFGIAAIRGIVFINKEHKWAKSKLWLVAFIILNIISTITTWDGFFSILPSCASIMSIINYWIGNPRFARRFQIPISLTFLVYNIFSRSYMGILNEILTQISIFTALFITEKKQ